MKKSELTKLVVSRRLTETDAAVAFIWWNSKFEGVAESSTSEIKAFFHSEDISTPNITRLKQRLIADRRLLKNSGCTSFRVRASAAAALEEEFAPDAPEPANSNTGATRDMAALETHARSLSAHETRSFVLEAVECAKSGCRRAAIIMAWTGAVSVLQDYVFQKHLIAFNADATANGVLKKPATTLSDLRDIAKESLFLDSLFRIAAIDSSQKKALKRCLDLRNDCGHPSQLKLGDATVAGHIEALLLNVFDPFGAQLSKAA